MKKTRKPLQLDSETHERLKKIKRDLSALEGKDLSMNEIIKRTISNREIEERLKIGSKQRRYGLK